MEKRISRMSGSSIASVCHTGGSFEMANLDNNASGGVSMLSPIDLAKELAGKTKNADLNEADTRHQVIDQILHGVLGWPRELTKVESFISPGYADYCLVRPDDTQLIFVEAKREGTYFQVPGFTRDE